MKKCVHRLSYRISIIKVLITFLLCGLSHYPYAITPEDVLGEYWKDPLFGRAASTQEVKMELLYRRIWPQEVSLKAGENVRFLVANRGKELHVLLFSQDLEPPIEDEHFKMFIADEVHHASQTERAHSASHSHAHHSSSVDETQDIVKTVEQKPTLLVKPGEEKEILIRLDSAGEYYAYCVLHEHWKQGYVAAIRVTHEDQED